MAISEEPRRMSCPAYGASLWETSDHVPQLAAVGNRNEATSLLDLPTYSRETVGGTKTSRRYWHHRIVRLKTEVHRMCSKFRLAKSHLIDGYKNLRARMSPSGDLSSPTTGRNLRVEYATHHRRKRKHRSCDDLLTDGDDCFDAPYHNFNSSLVIHALQEGKFSAEILLEKFPTEDDIIVRVHNYNLEVLLQKRVSSRKDGHHVSRPHRCGAMDIPIYVDPCSLSFAVIDNALIIEGDTKCFIPRRLSYSTDDINTYKTGGHQCTVPVVRKIYSGNAKQYRARSNTR